MTSAELGGALLCGAGVGTATADALCALVAAFGLGVLAATLLEHATALRVAGGFLLAWLGLGALWRAAAVTGPAAGGTAAVYPGTPADLAGAFSTFALTLANPMTVLSFAGVVAALGGAGSGLALVAGVFLGSVTWLLLVGSVRRMLPPDALRLIEGLSGIILLGFGGCTLLTGRGALA